MKKTYIDINADIGEGYGIYKLGNDIELMDFITSVNIACGFHAGDYRIMDQVVKEAVEKKLNIGAHPGYPDRYGFGRRPMSFNKDEIRAQLLYQIGSLKAIVDYYGGRLNHVKLHGALYNAAAVDYDLSITIAKAIKRVDPKLILIGLSGSEMIRGAKEVGLSVLSEVFSDRRYSQGGQLVSRSIEGSVLTESQDVLKQVTDIVQYSQVTAITGEKVFVEADTICVHGDTPRSIELAKLINQVVNERNEA